MKPIHALLAMLVIPVTLQETVQLSRSELQKAYGEPTGGFSSSVTVTLNATLRFSSTCHLLGVAVSHGGTLSDVPMTLTLTYQGKLVRGRAVGNDDYSGDLSNASPVGDLTALLCGPGETLGGYFLIVLSPYTITGYAP